mmetsp:Transcript_112382/g.357184  ORF Transcript_112382/g.357184 Transcript_112382/m.357184 type:complete len:379 (+) Transcript_112382:888-2024(+)
MHPLQHVLELLLQLDDHALLLHVICVPSVGRVPGALAADLAGLVELPQKTLGALKGALHPVHILVQPLALDFLQEALQRLPEERVHGSDSECETSRDQQGLDSHLRVEIRSQCGSEQEAEPHGQQHEQLPGIHAHLGNLHQVEARAPATLSEEDHRDAAQSRADVGDGARDVSRPHHGAEVGSAHGVLQTRCDRREARRDDLLLGRGDLGLVRQKHCNHQQQRVAHQRQTVARLATEVHLILVDEHAASEGTEQEGDNQHRRVGEGAELSVALMIALDVHTDRSGEPGHVGDIECPSTEGDNVDQACAHGQGPTEDEHPRARTLEAGRGFLRLHLHLGALRRSQPRHIVRRRRRQRRTDRPPRGVRLALRCRRGRGPL